MLEIICLIAYIVINDNEETEMFSVNEKRPAHENTVRSSIRETSPEPNKRSTLAVLVKLLGIFLITAAHAVRFFAAGIFISFSKRYGTWRLYQWAVHLKRYMMIAITVNGELPKEGCLLVANHRSYIDVIAIGATIPIAFLAKAEIAKWPLIGFGCKITGVVFVDRNSKESRKQSRAGIIEHMNNGASIMVFPEGTSYEGPGVLPFKTGIFATAAENGFPVVPVAIEYEDRSDAWVGDDTFVRHFFQAFRKKRLGVTVSFGPELKSSDQEKLKIESWTWINKTLHEYNLQ